MSVIGIDLSLVSTGVATVLPGGQAYTRSVTSTGKRDDSLADRVGRIRGLAEDITDGAADCDLVVIEAAAYSRGAGSGSWDRAGLWWAVVQRLASRGVPVALCAPSTRAKWAAGTGKADKAAVAAAMARLFPDVEIANSDEADALALAHIGAVHAGYPVATLARHDTKAMAAVKWGDAA